MGSLASRADSIPGPRPPPACRYCVLSRSCCHDAAVTISLRTERLVIEDAGPDDVEGLLAGPPSKPPVPPTREGSGGEPGAYDRSMLERDLAVAGLDPLRHPLVVRRTDGEVVGWAEVLDEHPRDGVPWIGLLEMRADVHRQGLGREAAEALAGWYAARGSTAGRPGGGHGQDAAAGVLR